MNIEFVSKNKNGDFYIGYRVPVQRGIRGKTRGKVDELIIVGVPKADMPKFCEEHGIRIEEIKEDEK